MNLENATPQIYATKSRTYRQGLNFSDKNSLYDSSISDPIDALEIFDYIRDINDPEHPYTLEELNVIQEELIQIGYKRINNDVEKPQTLLDYVDVRFTPTIPHCSMATLIGLAIHVKLRRSLHPSVKVLVRISPGSHNTEEAINRQLADKERVAAAIENPNLMQTINTCLKPRE